MIHHAFISITLSSSYIVTILLKAYDRLFAKYDLKGQKNLKDLRIIIFLPSNANHIGNINWRMRGCVEELKSMVRHNLCSKDLAYKVHFWN